MIKKRRKEDLRGVSSVNVATGTAVLASVATAAPVGGSPVGCAWSGGPCGTASGCEAVARGTPIAGCPKRGAGIPPPATGCAWRGWACRGCAWRGSAWSGCAWSGSALRGGALTGEAVIGGALSGGALSGGALSGGALRGGALTGGALRGATLSGGALTGGAGGCFVAVSSCNCASYAFFLPALSRVVRAEEISFSNFWEASDFEPD